MGQRLAMFVWTAIGTISRTSVLSAFSCKVFGRPSSNIRWAVLQCINLVEFIRLKGTTIGTGSDWSRDKDVSANWLDRHLRA